MSLPFFCNNNSLLSGRHFSIRNTTNNIMSMRLYFRLAILSTLMLALISCSKQNEEERTPGMTTISFSMAGEIAAVDIPMSKAEDNNDVYAILAYYYPKNSTTKVPFAYGVFNDISNLSLDVYCDTKYEFQAYCIKQGMEDEKCFYMYENNQGTPIKNADITNSFTYSASQELRENIVPTRDAYYGEDVRTITGASNISFNLLRCVFGVKIEVENLTAGSLKFEINTSYVFNFTPEVTTIEAPFLHFNHWDTPLMSVYIRHQEGIESEQLGVKATYTDVNGKQTVVAEEVVEFTRNKKKLISVVLKEAPSSEVSESFSFIVDDEVMGDDTPIVLAEE